MSRLKSRAPRAALFQVLRSRQVFQVAQSELFEEALRGAVTYFALLSIRPPNDGDQSAAHELPEK